MATWTSELTGRTLSAGGWDGGGAAGIARRTSGSSSGSDRDSGKFSFAPGQGSIYTPDPTVNGPWTHTRADIPLFKPATPATPATPASGQPNPSQWGSKTGFSFKPGDRTGFSSNPAFQQWRTAMQSWRSGMPQMPADYKSQWDTWQSQRPARPDFRSMLADTLSNWRGRDDR